MSRDILIGTYKILRRLGAERDEILPETAFKTDLFFDEIDQTCLLFLIETNFNISISKNEEATLSTVNDLIEIVYKHKSALLN
ncbi:MAG: hypothetical protein JEZ09_06915 [Salinivirgaceae bacterium]|nr:hypothetical protein [Salinivirgaceae bacterium]